MERMGQLASDTETLLVQEYDGHTQFAGVANVGCTTILGSSGSRYRPGRWNSSSSTSCRFLHQHHASLHSFRWAMQNPALVAPVLLDYDVQENLACTACVYYSCLIEHSFDCGRAQCTPEAGRMVPAVLRYRSPLMASLADGALVVSAPADITVDRLAASDGFWCLLRTVVAKLVFFTTARAKLRPTST